MFRDLKEYQQIQKIYEEKVCISDEERIITKIFEEQEFTEEELAYVKENLEEVVSQATNEILEEIQEGKYLNEEFITEEDKQLQVDVLLDEGIGSVIKAGLKAAKPMLSKAKPLIKKGTEAMTKVGAKLKTGVVDKVKSGIKSVASNPGVQKAVSGAKDVLKKGANVVKKALPVAGVAGAVTGGVAAVRSALKNKNKNVDTSSEIESSEAEFKANEGDKVNQRFKKDVGIVRRSQMSGKERAQALAKKRIGSGTAKNPDTKIQDVKDANTASMKAKAAERNQKFQAAKKEGPEAMKKYREENPKLSGKERAQAMAKERIAAKKRLSDANIKVEDYTPYDIVLEYLLSSKQAATIEEANYIMTEMDAKTIQSIVAE